MKVKLSTGVEERRTLMDPNLLHLVFLLVLVMGEGSAHSVAPLTVPRQGKRTTAYVHQARDGKSGSPSATQKYPVGEADTPCLLQSGKE